MSKITSYTYAKNWGLTDNEYALMHKIGWRMIKQGRIVWKQYKHDLDDFGIKECVYMVTRFGYNWRLILLDGYVCSIEKCSKVGPVI